MEEEHRNDVLFGGNFTEDERRALRRLLRDEERSRWAWKTFRQWVGWVVATVTTLYIAGDWIITLFKKFFVLKGG